jgi:hypothetical protein
MKTQEALIAWNSPRDDRGSNDPAKFLPRIKVVRKADPFPRGWADGYRSTNGACCSDWRTANIDEATLNILLLSRRLALQGIPPLEIHRAFFEIEEYRRAGGGDMSLDGDEFNP